MLLYIGILIGIGLSVLFSRVREMFRGALQGMDDRWLNGKPSIPRKTIQEMKPEELEQFQRELQIRERELEVWTNELRSRENRNAGMS